MCSELKKKCLKGNFILVSNFYTANSLGLSQYVTKVNARKILMSNYTVFQDLGNPFFLGL